MLATVSLGKEVNVSSSAAGVPHTAVCWEGGDCFKRSVILTAGKRKGRKEQMRMRDHVKPVPVAVVQK